MIEAKYTITYADYKAANRLYLRHRPWAGIGYILTIWIFPIFGACFLAWSLWLRAHDMDVPLHDPAGMFLVAWLAFVFPLARWLQLRRCYRTLFPKGAPKVACLTVNDEQVISAIPDRSEGRFYWRAIQDHAENKNGMILFVQKKRFLVVPHHALNEAQSAELRALIAAKLGKP
jgi:hypothetical protein